MDNKKVSFSFPSFADTITEIITEIIPTEDKKDNFKSENSNSKKEDFFSIAIFGSWGSGKTTLINQINENLLEKNIKTVNFDAFSSACSCKKSVLLSLLNEIMNSIEVDEKYKEKFYPIIRNNDDNDKKNSFFNKLYAVIFFPIAYVCFKLDRAYISIPAIFNSIYQGEIKLRSPGNIFEYSLNLNRLYLNYYTENSEYNEKLFQSYLGNIIDSWLNNQELYKNTKLNSLKDNDSSFFQSKKGSYYSIWFKNFFLSDLITKVLKDKASSICITIISTFIFILYILLFANINEILANTLKHSIQVLFAFLNICLFLISLFAFIPYLTYEILTHNKSSDSKSHNNDNKNSQKKLVIFVDNIDRCDSNEIITFVKALGSLFRIDNCLFIVTFDKEKILKIPLMSDTNFNNNDKNSNSYFDSNEYLKKIFKQCFYLPDKYQQSIHLHFTENFLLYFASDIFSENHKSLANLLLKIICHITTNIRTIEFLISQYCFEVKLLKKLKIIDKPDSKKNKTEFIYYILILYLVILKNWDNIKFDKIQDYTEYPDIENQIEEFPNFEYAFTNKITKYFSELRFVLKQKLEHYRMEKTFFDAYNHIINTINNKEKVIVKDNRLKFLLLFRGEDLTKIVENLYENESFEDIISSQNINMHFKKLKKIIYLDPLINIEEVEKKYIKKDSEAEETALKGKLDNISLIFLLTNLNIDLGSSQKLAKEIIKEDIDLTKKDDKYTRQLAELIFKICHNPTPEVNWNLAEKIINDYNDSKDKKY